jgi:hypothetical protein
VPGSLSPLSVPFGPGVQNVSFAIGGPDPTRNLTRLGSDYEFWLGANRCNVSFVGFDPSQLLQNVTCYTRDVIGAVRLLLRRNGVVIASSQQQVTTAAPIIRAETLRQLKFATGTSLLQLSPGPQKIFFDGDGFAYASQFMALQSVWYGPPAAPQQ